MDKKQVPVSESSGSLPPAKVASGSGVSLGVDGESLVKRLSHCQEKGKVENQFERLKRGLKDPFLDQSRSVLVC